MTSLLRTISKAPEGLTKFIKPESACYNDSVLGSDVLFPFTFTKGVLDITYDGNNFEADMVTDICNAPLDETDTAVRIIGGGGHIVTSLGDNFKDYIRAWRYATIDVGSPILVHLPAQVIRVQQANPEHINSTSDNIYTISSERPSNDDFLYGNTTTKFNTTYVFKTPLTFTIVESGVTQYITFRTIFNQE